jgi:hypothetical protein
VDDALDPPLAFRPHDHARVAQGDARAQELEAVGGGIAQERCVAGRRGRDPQHVGKTRPGSRLERQHDVGAVVVELRGKRERERAAAREQHPLTRQHALGLDERLRRARRQHAGQRPAGEDEGAVVRAGRDEEPAGRHRARALPLAGEHHFVAVDGKRARQRQ